MSWWHSTGCVLKRHHHSGTTSKFYIRALNNYFHSLFCQKVIIKWYFSCYSSHNLQISKLFNKMPQNLTICPWFLDLMIFLNRFAKVMFFWIFSKCVNTPYPNEQLSWNIFLFLQNIFVLINLFLLHLFGTFKYASKFENSSINNFSTD